MAQNWAESTWEITNDGRFINQYPPNIIRLIRQFERINIKISSKNYRFSRHFILGICNPNLIQLILKLVLMYLNIFSY